MHMATYVYYPWQFRLKQWFEPFLDRTKHWGH